MCLVAEKLEYLGHVVGGGTVAIPQARVEAIKNFRKSVTKKKLHYVTGLFVRTSNVYF